MEQNSKHTPVEWIAGKKNNPDYIDIDANGERICSVYVGAEANPEAEENAEMICKAVNNYQSLVDALNDCLRCLTMDSDMEEDFAPEIKKAKKALSHTGKW